MTGGAPLRDCIIHLLGFAGTGKLTIARALAARTGAVLVDNHLVNNPVLAVVGADGRTPLPPRVWDHIRQVRATVFSAIIELGPPGASYILTNDLREGDSADAELFAAVTRLAAARGARLLPVRLRCAPDEHRRRIADPARRPALKAIDPEAVARDQADHVLRPEGHPWLDLDVTSLKPEAAAARILSALVSPS